MSKLDILGHIPLLMNGAWSSEDGPTAADQLFLFASEQDALSIDFLYEAAIPGYREIRKTITASRVLGSPDEIHVLVKRTEQGDGVLRVTLADGARRAGALMPGVAPLRVELFAGTTRIQASLEFDSDGTALVAGLPFGRYQVVVSSRAGFFRWPLPQKPIESVEVSARPTQVVVPVDQRGGLIVTVRGLDGIEYAGSLHGSIALRRKDDNYVDSFFFASAPYAFALLPAGRYAIALLGQPLSAAREVEVLASECASLEVTLPYDREDQ